MKIVAEIVTLAVGFSVWIFLKPYLSWGGFFVGSIVAYYLRPFVFALLGVRISKKTEESSKIIDDGDDLEETKLNSNNPSSVENQSDKLCIGMPYDEIVKLLGNPSGINPGAEMLESGPDSTIVASKEVRDRLACTQYCSWKRPEGFYLLVIEYGKLARIHSKP